MIDKQSHKIAIASCLKVAGLIKKVGNPGIFMRRSSLL
jgi:hypothetical protein